MDELKESIERLPDWARYVLAIPFGILCVLAVDLLFYISQDLFFSKESDLIKLFNFIVKNGLNFMILFVGINWMLPRYRFIITLIISLITFLINAILIGIEMANYTLSLDFCFAWIVTTICLAISCYYSFKSEKDID
jgi:hypothetical protein